jgi:hypothetical protein
MQSLKLGPFITTALFKGKTKNYKARVTDVNLKGRINGWEVLGGWQSSGWERAEIEPNRGRKDEWGLAYWFVEARAGQIM